MNDSIIVGNVHSRTPPQDSQQIPPLLDSTEPDSPDTSSSPSASSSSSSSSPLVLPSSHSPRKSSYLTSAEVKPSRELEQDPSAQRLVPEQVCVIVQLSHVVCIHFFSRLTGNTADGGLHTIDEVLCNLYWTSHAVWWKKAKVNLNLDMQTETSLQSFGK